MSDARSLFLPGVLLISLALCGMFGYLLGYQEGQFRCWYDSYLKRSPPVSVTGPSDLPDHPPTPPPVADAGGETG
jgi:hypothetical protein